MSHSYEEIRSVALAILWNKEIVPHYPNQYLSLYSSVSYAFAKRENKLHSSLNGYQLDYEDKGIMHELFWDLFRQGIITLGLNEANPNFPFFRITEYGKKMSDGQLGYFFHDSIHMRQLFVMKYLVCIM